MKLTRHVGIQGGFEWICNAHACNPKEKRMTYHLSLAYLGNDDDADQSSIFGW